MTYSKYPWDLWFDGKLHIVTKEDPKTASIGLKHLRTLMIRHLYRRSKNAYLAAEIMGPAMKFQVFPSEEEATWRNDD